MRDGRKGERTKLRVKIAAKDETCQTEAKETPYRTRGW
jgi:hypothetical protein